MDWPEVLRELKPDADALVEERTAFATRHQAALLDSLPRDESREEALIRLHALAFEAMTTWRPDAKPLDSFLQLAIVDAHDATVDAIAGIGCGIGPPAVALLRRQYELMLLLTAGWLDPAGLQQLMEEALKRPFTDDRYTEAARLGLLGAVMPKAWKLRDMGLTAGSNPEERVMAEAVEAGLASFGHGGALAAVGYLGTGRSHLEDMLEMARAYQPLLSSTTALVSASASQIAARLGYDQVYGSTDTVFGLDVVNARESQAMQAFDEAFPLALDVLWATFLGLNSVNIELTERLGAQGNSPERRQLIVFMDGLETAWIATEYLFRGHLSGAATLVRRLFELALEAQAWLTKQNTMTKRFVTKANRLDDRDRTMPSPTTMIRWLHGTESSALQRQTYSTLCSAAHGGAQAQDYLLDGDGSLLVIRPAPHFAHRHDAWLLGTLISGVDALLGAALLIAARYDEGIVRNHWGYHEFFRAAQQDIRGLTLVGHLDLDGIDEPSFESPK
jgi:hypothetical protein